MCQRERRAWRQADLTNSSTCPFPKEARGVCEQPHTPLLLEGGPGTGSGYPGGRQGD